MITNLGKLYVLGGDDQHLAIGLDDEFEYEDDGFEGDEGEAEDEAEADELLEEGLAG